MTFGATGGFAAPAGWALQNATPTEQSERATASSKTGNVTDSELYDKRKSWTCTFKAKVDYSKVAPTIPTEIGAIVDNILLTSIQINTTDTDFATMVLSGHEHIDGTDGTTMRKIAHNIMLTKGFGANAFGCTGGTNVESGSCSISCDHAETKNENGDTAQGENYNPRIEVNVTMNGSGAAAPAAYDETSVDTPTENAGFVKSSVSAIKDLAFTE